MGLGLHLHVKGAGWLHSGLRRTSQTGKHLHPLPRTIRLEHSRALMAAAEAHWLPDGWKLILGTSSSSRRGIMDRAAKEHGFTYTVATAELDERALGDRTQSPETLVSLLARAKATAIQKKLEPQKAVLVTCDQVVVHKGQIREKPLNEQEAWAFIRAYREAPAETVGALVCTNLLTSHSAEELDYTKIYFNHIPDNAIETMIEEGFVYYCAGGLMVEHPQCSPYIASVEGTMDSVMGIEPSLVHKLVQQVVQH